MPKIHAEVLVNMNFRDNERMTTEVRSQLRGIVTNVITDQSLAVLKSEEDRDGVVKHRTELYVFTDQEFRDLVRDIERRVQQGRPILIP